MSGPRSGRALRAPRGERMPPNADARGRECAPSRSGASVDVCVCVCVCVCVSMRAPDRLRAGSSGSTYLKCPSAGPCKEKQLKTCS